MEDAVAKGPKEVHRELQGQDVSTRSVGMFMHLQMRLATTHNAYYVTAQTVLALLKLKLKPPVHVAALSVAYKSATGKRMRVATHPSRHDLH